MSRVLRREDDLAAEVKEIETAIAAGKVDEPWLARRLRNLKKMAPEIAEVALAALSGPGAAVGAIRALPTVSAVHHGNGSLAIEFHQSTSSAPIVSLLVNHGVQIEEVRKGKADLEQAFLALLEQE